MGAGEWDDISKIAALIILAIFEIFEI